MKANTATMDSSIKTSRKTKRNSQFQEAWGRLKKNKLAMISLVILILVVLMAIFADVIADYDEKVIYQDYSSMYETFSSEHIFGTDTYGRDIFARVVHGARVSLVLGFGGTLIATVLACIIGSTCALFGGVYDNIVMRLVDMLITIPAMLLSMTIVAGLGTGVPQLIVAITITQTVSQTRVVRAAVLNVANQEYIEAARALGANNFRIITKYVLPNAIGTILVQATMQVAHNILLGATLGFLGMGAKPPAPEWGAMLSEAMSYMQHYPHLIIGPGVMLIITSLTISIFGDALRDAIDPKLKGRA